MRDFFLNINENQSFFLTAFAMIIFFLILLNIFIWIIFKIFQISKEEKEK